mgnify:CR=1 FL=1
MDRGAEGIGLFRTEVPFMSQDRFPTEMEQRALYREHMDDEGYDSSVCNDDVANMQILLGKVVQLLCR